MPSTRTPACHQPPWVQHLTGLRPSPTSHAVSLAFRGLRPGRMTRDGGAGRVYELRCGSGWPGGRLISDRSL